MQASATADAAPTVLNASAGPDAAEVDVGGVHMTLTLADGEALKKALLERLRSQPFIEDRDYLINDTQNVGPSIVEGHLCIGTWTVLARRDRLELNYRMPPGSEVMLFYSARVERQGDKWLVGEIVQGHIRRR